MQLLRRLADRTDEVVHAPVFRRELEPAEAGALPVPRSVPLVVTEGNDLLLDGPFAPVRPLLTECWYVEVEPGLRRQRLVARHVRHGRTVEQAEQWVRATDEPNARLFASSRERADVVTEPD